MLLLSSALAAQTPDWRPPNLQQYFKQFKLPATNPTPKITLAPGQACAIPLVNVLKKDATNDRMVVHPARGKNPGTIVVTPPAPSCDDVR
jgi:hypothetical protein